MSNVRISRTFSLSPRKRDSLSTPSRRQSMGLALSANSPNTAVLVEGTKNNDEVEKRERQLNRLQQLRSKGISSPTGTPSDRRKSAAFSGLSNQQISEHYAKCIQLSAENKINIKNAFNLQLIDCMSELLKKKDSNMNNFQMASCSLDASTKIYGYRVDSVHADTLKMAGGLGRTKDAPGEMAEGTADGETVGVKKKTRAKKCVTVEANLKNINVAHFDLEFDVDPLFKKMACQFNDGASGGSQFLNTLHLLDDGCQLVLDSETMVWEVPRSDPVALDYTFLPPIRENLDLKICPTFATFEFSSWDLRNEDSFTDGKSRIGSEEGLAFDINAVPEPLDQDLPVDQLDQEDLLEAPTADDNGEVFCDETAITVGGGACRAGPLPPPQFEIVHLKDHLANVPLEYSYFDSKVTSAWAGPGHWKIKSFKKASTRLTSESSAKDKFKKDFILDYDQVDENLEKHFAELRASTRLSQNTIKKWTDYATTLPVDLHYDPAKFNRSYLRPEILIRRQSSKDGSVGDNASNGEVNCENDIDSHSAQDGAVDADPEGESMLGHEFTDIFSQTVVPCEQQPLAENQLTQDFHGSNLVEAPDKVNLFNIGYARTAKKINMKKLKTTLWDVLRDSTINKENTSANIIDHNRQFLNKKEFSQVYTDLSPRLPSKMAENLSVPLAFIALLHLANEHSLKLESLNELGDFVISQD